MDTLLEKLKEHGLVTSQAIAEATDRQWREGGNLIYHLVEMGAVTEEDLLSFYQKVLGIHTVRLKEVEIDPEAVWHIPYRIAQKYFLIPIKRTRKTLIVAMANPLNQRARKEMEFVTDLEIIPLGAMLSEIKDAITQHYGKKDLPLDLGAFWLRPRRELTLKNLEHRGILPGDLVSHKIEPFLKASSTGLTILGPPQSGKTSLLHAIANRILAEDPDRGVLLTQGGALKDLLVEGQEIGIFPSIRTYLEPYTFLLIDDLEQVFGGPRFEELVEWFLAKGASVVATTSQEISTFESSPKLFGWLRQWDTILLSAAEVELPAHIRSKPEAQQHSEVGLIQEAEPFPSVSLEFLAEQAKGKGVAFRVLPATTGTYPAWVLHGIMDLSKRILNAAEPGDSITLRTIESDRGWIVEFETKGLLLMVGEEAVRDSFGGRKIGLQKRPGHGGYVTLQIEIAKEESQDV